MFETTYLNLLKRQIQKCQIIADRNHRFRAFASHRCTETTIEFDYDQLAQHLRDCAIIVRGCQLKFKLFVSTQRC
jgi:hypothetical protein